MRHRILEYFYELHSQAKTRAAAKRSINEIKGDLKPKGLESEQIVPHVMYLVGSGFLREEITTFKIPGKDVTAKHEEYCISDLGVDYLEGASKFGKPRNTSDINVDNTGVLVIGDRNVTTYVQAPFEAIYRNLNVLARSLGITDSLSNEEKVNYRAEIETIKSQLAKTKPDVGIISRAWMVLQGFSSIPALAELVERIRTLIQPLIGHS